MCCLEQTLFGLQLFLHSIESECSDTPPRSECYPLGVLALNLCARLLPTSVTWLLLRIFILLHVGLFLGLFRDVPILFWCAVRQCTMWFDMIGLATNEANDWLLILSKTGELCSSRVIVVVTLLPLLG